VASEQERLASVKRNLDRIGEALRQVDQELRKQQAQEPPADGHVVRARKRPRSAA